MNNKNGKNIFTYLISIGILCASYYIVCVLSRGEFIQAVFVNDSGDTFMDYFNSISNAKFNPYTDAYSNYPALACLLYKVLFRVTPLELREADSFILRNVQAPLIIFILYNFFIIWFVELIIRKRAALDERNGILLSLVILPSAPFMFTIERGNLILLSFALSFFFVAFYDSESKVLRELSYCSLAVAAAIKIYPALLGMLLVKRKKIKESIRLLVYGITFFIIPFFYYGGIKALKIMLSALRYTSNLTEELGYGVNVSLYNICQTFSEILNLGISNWHISIISLAVFSLLVITFFVTQEKWLEFLSLVLIIILLPKTNYYYVMIFLIIPFVEFVKEWHNGNLRQRIYDIAFAVIYLIILVPWPLPKVVKLSEGKKYFVSYSMLIHYLAIIWLIVFILNKLLLSVFKNRKYAKICNIIICVVMAIFSLILFLSTL